MKVTQADLSGGESVKVIAFLLVFLSSLASAETPSSAETIVAGSILSATKALDVHSHLSCGCREANPFMRPIVKRGPVLTSVVSAGVIAGATYGFTKIKKPWVRWIFVGSISALHVGAAIHNYRLASKR